MKSRKLTCVVALTLFAAVPTALASTTWFVNGVTGSNKNNCKSSTTACKTIGHAISLASSGDTIRVAAATYVGFKISTSLTIVGSGAATAIIHGEVTIASTRTHVTLSNLSISNSTVGGPGFGGAGGGIYNAGILTINHVIISGNSAVCYPLRVNEACGAEGGGIYNGGTLTVNNSTISGNSVTFTCLLFGLYCNGHGGGIDNGGTLTVNNSTISGNSVVGRCANGAKCFVSGGGIFGGGKISNSTISGNSGNGISSGGMTLTLQNSIVANNTQGPNCIGTMTSEGYNLSSDGTCAFSGPGDMNNTDPMLGPLQDNGGPTQTMALPSGSPAVDAGNPSGCTDGQGHLLKTDQRGFPRHDPEDIRGCDMGAYERQGD